MNIIGRYNQDSFADYAWACEFYQDAFGVRGNQHNYDNHGRWVWLWTVFNRRK